MAVSLDDLPDPFENPLDKLPDPFSADYERPGTVGPSIKRSVGNMAGAGTRGGKIPKEGAVYTDAQGNRARFQGGQFVPLQ